MTYRREVKQPQLGGWEMAYGLDVKMWAHHLNCYPSEAIEFLPDSVKSVGSTMIDLEGTIRERFLHVLYGGEESGEILT